MNQALLEIERHGCIATIWLNRPHVHNAFDEHLIAALTQTLGSLDCDGGVRVVVLAGRGKSFCAGGDLDWMRRMSGFSEAENLRDAGALAEMLRVLSTLSKPTIARVHGAALAGGLGLVAACDIAVAAPTASFGTTEVRLGLIPATISPYVIHAIGARAARRYFLTAERFDAEEAQRLGLIHVVCPSVSLDDCTAELAAALLAGGPAALRASKRLIHEVAGRVVDETLIGMTVKGIAEMRAAQEAREGIAAFFEKRKATWDSR
jgi:methylglutaconyl-CoA hydratase